MAKFLFLFSTVILSFYYASVCSATVYTVGDNSGWDISTDVNSWAKDKSFSVGDTLLFQYSQYHTVNEVKRDNYEGCNTTNNVIRSSSNGNASFALTGPGERYFVCGNRLHCLGGMKLHVTVHGNQVAVAPVGAPQSQPGGSLPPPGSSGTNNYYNPSNSSFLYRIEIDSIVLGFLVSLVFFLQVI
ncbi:hypothetical protein MIMGU_mgv1a022640mg [Erythranthe guttata]|uniref:Phytocyanin domain-containing protein n=2 Tax=Erythranthe guttata TaxID=4155 RepID=A0A022PWJ1_ERYGU|nr:hypothetical protein MIMGU_mgv1a022640mg [Erythranthe guttata]